MVIFSDLGWYLDDKYEASKGNIEKLQNLNDPRIWIIGRDAEYLSELITNDKPTDETERKPKETAPFEDDLLGDEETNTEFVYPEIKSE